MTRNTFILKIQRELCHPKSYGTFEKRAPGHEVTKTFKYIYIYMFWHSATFLWLVADFASVASYTTSVFGNVKPSRPRFCQVTTQQSQTTTPGIPCPTSEMNELIVVASSASLKCGNFRNNSVPNKGARYQNDICCRSIAAAAAATSSSRKHVWNWNCA